MPRDLELDWVRSREEVVAQDAAVSAWITHYEKQRSEYARGRVQRLKEIQGWLAQLVLLWDDIERQAVASAEGCTAVLQDHLGPSDPEDKLDYNLQKANNNVYKSTRSIMRRNAMDVWRAWANEVKHEDGVEDRSQKGRKKRFLSWLRGQRWDLTTGNPLAWPGQWEDEDEDDPL